MSNTFLDTSLVARDASIILSDNLVAAQLCNRNHESKFVPGVGSSITIKVPPVQTARDFIDDSLTTTANNITETGVALALTEQPYVKHTILTSEKTLDLDDFNVVVTQPCVLAIRDAVDTYICKRMVNGFSQGGVAGTDGNQPSSLAHLAAGIALLNNNKCPMNDRIGLLNATSHASYIQLVQFISGDYGSSRPAGLAEATLGRLYGCEWFMDQNMVTMARGDVGNATQVYGGGQSGSTLIVDNAAGSSTGTIVQGSRFTINGVAGEYVVTSDSTASGVSFTLSIYPALASGPADDATITWIAAVTGNVMYTKNAICAAIVPPAPLAVESSVAFYNGVGIRVTMSSSTSTLSDDIVFDTYDGARVIEKFGGIVVQG
jgi:hypothetical protein